MNENPFVHLHVHTEYSLLDGAAPLDKLVAAAKASGAPALAITDHGNMYGAIKFYNLCVQKGIKPIIGCEFYVTEDMSRREGSLRDEWNKPYHLILLAKNHEAYMNLARLNSAAWIDGFYFKPRIELSVLEKYSKDLICLSACLAGYLPRALLKGDYKGAKEYAIKLRDMFAEGDFYIELQDHGLQEQKETNPLLVKIAREIGVKCVATNDVHYIRKEDSETHDVLLCIQTAKFIDDTDRMRFPNDEFYLKSYDEMKAALGWCPEALETPLEIADKCNISFEFNKYQLPRYDCPDNMAPADYLRRLSQEGLVRRYGTITEEIAARAETELSVIISMGFAEYYLIVWDFIFWAKANDIPIGAGRGSGVGSIIAYAIGITDVDPLQYNLIFERFLNKDRTSMPDFDIDICYNRRGEVIQYVKDKYGADRISQIITFGKMKKKQAIKDVARVYRMPFADVTKLTKSIGFFGNEDNKVHIRDLITEGGPYCVPDLVASYNENPEYKKIIDIAMQIEGMPRNTSIHAAGVVIYKNAAVDTIPLAKNGEEITTQFDMIEVEKLGLLKMDFLALMTLTDIKMAHDYVLSAYGKDIDFDELGYKDPEVYSFIASGATDAVFQLEGGGMKKFMTRFKPVCFEDIIAGISIYRPGPMDNIDLFLENRKNPEAIVYKHPSLEPILNVTSGIIIYQEQAMMITRMLAGYDMTRADAFRSIISKKKADKIPAERAAFVDGVLGADGSVKIPGCVRNGIDRETAESIFKEMESFASYAFNKSHAAAYAVLSYQTAYFMRYYPVEYLAAVINNRIDKPDDTKKYMAVIKNIGVALLPPDINKSLPMFSPEQKSIRYGLACIKNVGMAAMNEVIAERTARGAFKSFLDFCERVNTQYLNKRMLESLILGGAFDCFGMTRATLMANYEQITAMIESKRKREASGQIDFFTVMGEEPSNYQYKIIKEFPTFEKLMREKELLGMYVSGHPLEGREEEFKEFNFNTSMLPKQRGEDETEEQEFDEEVVETTLTENMEVRTGGLLSNVTFKRTRDGREMGIAHIEDMYDKIEIVVLGRTFAEVKKELRNENLVKIRGRLSMKDGEAHIYVSDLKPWSLAEKEEEEIYDSRVLYFHITEQDLGLLDSIDKIIAAHEGPNTVRMQYNKELLNYNRKVNNLELVERELAGLLGSENVKII